MFYIVGLGNPGEEYEGTRHNTGRIILDAFRKAQSFSEWTLDKKIQALTSEGKIKKEKVFLIEPETFMNTSGKNLGALITSLKKAESLVVIQDDLDLPIGSFKISFNRGSGGHRGVESIMRAIKTEAFTRIRVGISPVTSGGKLKKPHGEKEVGDFILAQFKKQEQDMLKKVSKKISEALTVLVTDSRERAMGEFN